MRVDDPKSGPGFCGQEDLIAKEKEKRKCGRQVYSERIYNNRRAQNTGNSCGVGCIYYICGSCVGHGYRDLSPALQRRSPVVCSIQRKSLEMDIALLRASRVRVVVVSSMWPLCISNQGFVAMVVSLLNAGFPIRSLLLVIHTGQQGLNT